jgi:carboxypeptidase C (cathepsin A)
MKILHITSLSLSLLFLLPALGQNETKTAIFPEPQVTEHQLTLQGKRFNYTAKAGHMDMFDTDGKPLSKIFYVAYTAKGLANRPVTFVFNGGPGSSSVWLHMGALGPKRVVMTDDGLSIAPPYEIVDNDYSWLSHTDLVFIDPVETGFSRPAEDVSKSKFTGYQEDLKSVGDFIHAYVTENGRWSSPKFLAGESYGTTRASGLSGYLQDRHGMFLNGIVLISAILNFQTAYFSEGNDLPYALFLPSYAAVAYHHNKIDKQRFPTLDDLLKAVENFSLNEYNTALMQGDQLSEQDNDVIAQQLANFTGLSKNFIKQQQLRVSVPAFTKELLRDESLTIGRFDGAVTGRDKNDAGERYEFDPSYNKSIFGGYTMAINEHLYKNLNYKHRTHVYEILTGNVWPWNYGSAQNKFLDNSQTLRQAIHKNPFLKVLIANGYYDMATPYFATEYTVNHMFLHPEYRDNITMTYYKAGHMMYSVKTELEQFTKDVRTFYESY